MDSIEFYTENNEYIIRIRKQKKYFSQTKFGQYDCFIEFLNNLKFTVLSIQCTEKELYKCIQQMNEFSENMTMFPEQELCTVIKLSSNGSFKDYFINLSTDNLYNNPKEYPSEDDDMILHILIYEKYIKNQVTRLYLPVTYSFLGVIIYSIYSILEDIPYLNDINNEFIDEFLKGELQ